MEEKLPLMEKIVQIEMEWPLIEEEWSLMVKENDSQFQMINICTDDMTPTPIVVKQTLKCTRFSCAIKWKN